MQSLDELFAHELQDMLGAEQTVASALEQLSQCQTEPQLQQVFSTHLAETQTQIQRLQDVCSMVGVQAMATTDEGAKGLVREHDQFVAHNLPEPSVHSVFDAAAGQKVEQYEITAYESLLDLATALGYQQAAQLIQANLDEERQQFQRLQQASSISGQSQQSMQGQQAGGQQQLAQQSQQRGQRQPQQQMAQQPQQQSQQPQQQYQQPQQQSQQSRQTAQQPPAANGGQQGGRQQSQQLPQQ